MIDRSTQTASPRRFPVCRLVGLLLAGVCSVVAFQCWVWSAGPLRSFYLPVYARLSVLPNLSRAHWSVGKSVPQSTSFPIAFVGNTVATEALLPRLSGPLSTRSLPLDRAAFYTWLKQNVYGGRTLTRSMAWVLYFAETCFGLFFLIGGYFDQRQLRQARNGQLLRGPDLISRWRFNRKVKGDGLAFRLENARNLFELLMPGDTGRYLRIPRDREAHHIQIAGDTGSGKSTLIRQILYQIESRSEVAIIFDPDREYIQEFFREDRGDWVLNPKDERCPYWPIGEEVTDEATATPVANGFFPEGPSVQKFFLTHTRAIFAYLLARYKPTVNDLAYWMAHPEEIDKRVKGTEHEHTLTANAAPQRAGILGSLNEAGKPLRMMPAHSEAERVNKNETDGAGV